MPIDKNFATARWWKPQKDKKLKCFLCPRECLLEDEQRGFCFLRQNQSGELKTSYGVISTLAIDPVEKKPLYHFYPGTQTLSLGTVGCNLGCSFCQNWQISKPTDLSFLSKQASPSMIAKTAKERSCQSVAFTYNEPIISSEYVIEIARECHAQGIKTIAVTAGYIHSLARKDFFEYVDAANVDLKSFSNQFYQTHCNATREPILDTLCFLKEKTNVWLELTNLIIPGENDADEEIGQMCAWIARYLGLDVPMHFSAFHPDDKMLQQKQTSKEALVKARAIAFDHGLRYVYTGNIFDIEGSTTFCYTCKNVLIERQGYTVSRKTFNDHGQCQSCQATCPGYF